MVLGGVWQDKRFDNCINALLEHRIVEPCTHSFTDKQGPYADISNQHFKNECLAEVRALTGQGMDVRPACRLVAARWGLGNSLAAGAQQLRDRLRPKKPKK
jgi:hypothetical protein